MTCLTLNKNKIILIFFVIRIEVDYIIFLNNVLHLRSYNFFGAVCIIMTTSLNYKYLGMLSVFEIVSLKLFTSKVTHNCQEITSHHV